MVVVGLVAALCVLGARAALLAPDRLGMLLDAGVTVWFGAQAFVNIGAVIGILPITGVPLPFVSYGGSSLLFSRSEEHTSELQSLMRISYAVIRLKKETTQEHHMHL